MNQEERFRQILTQLDLVQHQVDVLRIVVERAAREVRANSSDSDVSFHSADSGRNRRNDNNNNNNRNQQRPRGQNRRRRQEATQRARAWYDDQQRRGNVAHSPSRSA